MAYKSYESMTNLPRSGSRLPNVSCRLCGGQARFVFEKTLLGKHCVSFFVCADCGSMQTEEPYWLSEAYSDATLSIDPGAAQRVLDCVALTHSVMQLYSCRTSLDYGGGSGLLCRLLRDIGHDAYWYDGYTAPGYATGFESSPHKYHDIVTSFEVVEHFSSPKADWDSLFAARPKVLLIMTWLYEGQNADWWYIAPEEGQHIFFYSREAIELIGQRYGYVPLICSGFILFSRETPTTW